MFLMVALRGRALGQHFVNDLVWEVLAGALWVAGAIADSDARLVLWGLAVVTAYAGVSCLHWLPGRGRRVDLRHAELASEHLIERFRLFFIIALGETVLTMGTAFIDEPFALARLLALAIGFTGTVALWWNYFERAEEVAAEVAYRVQASVSSRRLAARSRGWSKPMSAPLGAVRGGPPPRSRRHHGPSSRRTHRCVPWADALLYGVAMTGNGVSTAMSRRLPRTVAEAA